ncbi:MAG: PEP-CTERM sorting domain-containing protein, partial [Armatimonadaceae bacterium]
TPGIFGIRLNANVPGASNEFAIGDVGVRLSPFPGGGVPEPGEWAAMGVMGSALGLLALRARRRHAISR